MKKARAFFLSTLTLALAGMLMTGCNRDKEETGTKGSDSPSMQPDTGAQPGTGAPGGTGTGGTGDDTSLSAPDTSLQDPGQGGAGRDTGMGGTGTDTGAGEAGSSGGAPEGTTPGGSSGGSY